VPGGSTLTARQDTARDSLGFVFEIMSAYRFDLQSAGVSLVPGGSYQLRVATRGGEVITGTTTIPSAIPAPVPALALFHRLRDTVRLSWAAVGGADGYEAQVWNEGTVTVFGENYASYDLRTLRYAAFLDTSLTLAGTARHFDDDIFFVDNTAMVVVYAVDANYYAYYRGVGDLFAGAVPSRLTGGLGVFGAVVPVAQRRLAVR
jgi:hypothetical protein